MDNWKISLDRYLTNPPDDGFDSWCERVLGEEISEHFYNHNEWWIDLYDGTCNDWCNRLFAKGVEPNHAAKIIERAFKLYRITFKKPNP